MAAKEKFLDKYYKRAAALFNKSNLPMPVAERRTSSGDSRILFTHSYNGEKNLGEIGPIRSYNLDYAALRARSWQALLESEMAQIIIRRYTTWMVGKGLRLQAEPNTTVLESEGITLDAQKFSKLVEARHSVWANAKESDYSRMFNKNFLSKVAKKNALVGGDVLLVLRYQEGRVSIQLVDGAHIQSPMPGFGDEVLAQVLPNGNRIIHGVELNAENEHVAYYVRKPGLLFETERVPVRGVEGGLVMARLIYGGQYRIDNVRGLPLLSTVLETAKKMERYKEATVGAAEERAKIPYYIKHEIGSDGGTPFGTKLARAAGHDPNDDIPKTDDGEVLANKIAATTNKQVFNMGMNQTLEAVENKGELYFKDFYVVNGEFLCATIEIPPAVAFSKYDTSYSSSRAANKDWEHTLDVGRHDHSLQCDQVIYEFFLEVEILRGKVKAPGYIQARMDGNYMALAAYRMARWAGANVPHIDPLKEVQAERLKLGTTAAAIPLGTVEQSTEALNGGDSHSNMEQFAQELQKSKDLGIEIPEPAVLPPGGDEDDAE